MSRILAIDPGPTESAYVRIGGDRRPEIFDKVPNEDLLRRLRSYVTHEIDRAAIEMIASYGMPVGAEVFDTCVWIGRFYETITHRTSNQPELVKRQSVKVHHCHSAKATDANVKQALVDRFASGIRNHGKGTKAEPGWFHGFRADVWQAYALAIYTADRMAGYGDAVDEEAMG